MAQVSDFVLDNQGFSSFRTELNNILSAQNSNNSGTSRPSSATTGTIWLDTTNSGSNSLTLKFFDGSEDISLANIDTSANTVNWLDSSVTTELVGDTTPQLGGNLDTNSHNIAFDDAHGIIDENGNEQITFQTTSSAVNQIDVTNSATGNAPEISATGGDTNIDLKLTPKGSGKLVLDGIKFPNADGSANQILQTDGGGNLSFASAGGGTSWQSSVKTANFTAVAGEGYFVNTSGGAFEIDLPSSPSVGDEIEFVDFSRSFATNNLTLDQGSNKFQGFTSPKPVYNVEGQSIKIVYSGSTQGWIPVRDDDVSNETPQTITVDYLVIGGGAGGGKLAAGGGGAGGYRNSFNNETSGGGGSSETALALSQSTVYTITVGDGGAGSTNASSKGTNGSDSSISGTGITTITSLGGGGGGSHSSIDGADGGAGGGGSGQNSSPAGTGGSGTSNQGFDGGNGDVNAPQNGAGGGGGSSQAGTNGGNNTGGDGGDGLSSSITGAGVTRAGGGGGSGKDNLPGGTGGTGGGGNGNTGSNGAGGVGTANTGSGGGGTHDVNGGAGGKGVVILRLATADYSGVTSGSPTVTTSGSDTIITFNASGSYTA